ncbi:LysM peptidoglycan-binding domain-containing protein [Streptomyces sp. OF3]|uniref:LysM peptidoglycan-binding domain-containing protein n=1 Tax=Streptomyces alkaliterrae TaxID=2213162 RepID=A0A7W3WIY2_9ACTN|nr:LysM peptidoglycan-binding domain-containing protein [Streptomyces alkaliterrae]MBB1253162.1 LysM peptidoglycan-binding domain-containing protein [Streptomyces alkaliterrae]
MTWYPAATRMELLPEARQQPTIRPTQLIVHSIVAPWTARRTYEYWRDSTNLESHFGLGYAGDLAQYLPTTTRADANASANRRPDGTGAISIETASNLQASDPWTPEQVAELVALGVWVHRTHGIPLRACRTADDPGFGYHSLHRAWSTSGTACPGARRITQWRDEVFPAIVAAAGGDKKPGGTHTVTKGDTLYSIAVSYKGVTWQQLAAANRLAAPYTIVPGQRLTVPGPATTPTKPPARPVVDLSRLIQAARTDPPKAGTPVTYPETLLVEMALVAEGLLERRLADGHFGTATVRGYAGWQRRLGYTGRDADGIPGMTSLRKLGAKRGFDVVP